MAGGVEERGGHLLRRHRFRRRRRGGDLPGSVDPRVAADISTDFAPIVAVEPDGPQAVTVRMDTDADPSPYLLLGIVPSERVETTPAAEWAINTAPVGTGAYALESLEPDQAVLAVRENYWGDTPSVRRLVYSHVPDDNTRAQRIGTGEIDGANLPPRLADGLTDRDGIEVVAVKSADWRGVSRCPTTMPSLPTRLHAWR